MTSPMKRRNLFAGALGVALLHLASGCTREARCKNCGMRVDPASAWKAELIGPGSLLVVFDTPRCALTFWRTGRQAAQALRVIEYYDRQPRDGAELRFVIGGDVLGPMGPDLVPVDAGRVSKFIQDHRADRALQLAEITSEVLAGVGSQ